QHDKSLLFTIPRSFFGGARHSDCNLPLDYEGKWKRNINMKCPASNDGPQYYEKRNLKESDIVPVVLIQQVQSNNQLQSVFQCGWCSAKFSPDNECEANQLIEHIKKYAKHQDDSKIEYYDEVCRRILSGYAINDDQDKIKTIESKS
ncbi:hypothetical protein LCGC14_2799590, partial [marine sediment metagenome]